MIKRYLWPNLKLGEEGYAAITIDTTCRLHKNDFLKTNCLQCGKPYNEDFRVEGAIIGPQRRIWWHTVMRNGLLTDCRYLLGGKVKNHKK